LNCIAVASAAELVGLEVVSSYGFPIFFLDRDERFLFAAKLIGGCLFFSYLAVYREQLAGADRRADDASKPLCAGFCDGTDERGASIIVNSCKPHPFNFKQFGGRKARLGSAAEVLRNELRRRCHHGVGWLRSRAGAAVACFSSSATPPPHRRRCAGTWRAPPR
jgi:hypothetical protein